MCQCGEVPRSERIVSQLGKYECSCSCDILSINLTAEQEDMVRGGQLKRLKDISILPRGDKNKINKLGLSCAKLRLS